MLKVAIPVSETKIKKTLAYQIDKLQQMSTLPELYCIGLAEYYHYKSLPCYSLEFTMQWRDDSLSLNLSLWVSAVHRIRKIPLHRLGQKQESIGFL